MPVGTSLSSVSEGSHDGAEQAVEVDEHIRALESCVGKLPKLPVYRPKGVWTDIDDVPKQQALIWAYNNYSTATDAARRFIVNAVAAIFEWQLLRYCSENCADKGPCAKCGHWEWVSEPEKAAKVKSNDELEWRAPFDEKNEENFVLLSHPQMQWMNGPGGLITKEAMRCAVSIVIASKADFWAEGPVKMEAGVEEDICSGLEKSMDIRKKALGKNASTLIKDLYPQWNVEDATEVVLTAGVWANTRNILAMIGPTPLPECISLWDAKPEAKLIFSPDLKKKFSTYPAGTEELRAFLAVANELVSSPLLIYFPSAEDLTLVLRAKESVCKKPFSYHKSAVELGIEAERCDLSSVFGRLGSFYLAKANANNEQLSKYWSIDRIKESGDFNDKFAEICNAFFCFNNAAENAACVLLQAMPSNDKDVLTKVLAEYQVAMTKSQKTLLGIPDNPEASSSGEC